MKIVHVMKPIHQLTLLVLLICLPSCSVSRQFQSTSPPEAHTDEIDNYKSVEISVAKQQLSVAQVITDVSLAKQAYERIHPGYMRYATQTEMNTAWQGIIDEADANGGMSLGDLYLNIQKTLTLIHCDHTKANVPKLLADERNQQPIYLPFRWIWLDGRAFITEINHSTPSNLTVNDEILSIDGRSIQSLVAQVLPFIPYDGYTKWSRNVGVADSLEFMGGALDHFGAFLWPTQPLVKLGIKKTSGEIKQLRAKRISYKQLRALSSKSSSQENFKDAITFKRIGKGIAFLKIDTFVNYRNPVQPNTIYNPIFKSIKDEKRKVLILDLRKNGGGSSDASLGLFANLIKEPRKAKVDMQVNTLNFDGIRQHLWTWDKRALEPNPQGFSKNSNGSYSLRPFVTDEMNTIEPAKFAFKGHIIALTGHSNSSGSTNLLANLQTQGNVTLVGEKTGGSAEGPTAGLLFTLTLPESQITTRIPFFRYKNNVEHFEAGMGIKPNVNVRMTADAFINNQDPALSKAISIASALLKKTNNLTTSKVFSL